MHDSTYVRYPEQSHSERQKVAWQLPGPGGAGLGVSREWGAMFNGYKAQEDENILDIDGGDGCTTMSMYLMPLNCTKMVNMVNLMFCIFYNKNMKNTIKCLRQQ